MIAVSTEQCSAVMTAPIMVCCVRVVALVSAVLLRVPGGELGQPGPGDGDPAPGRPHAPPLLNKVDTGPFRTN